MPENQWQISSHGRSATRGSRELETPTHLRIATTVASRDFPNLIVGDLVVGTAESLSLVCIEAEPLLLA